MANSIVFQNNAEQLKASVFGYNSSGNVYQPLQINNNGELKVTTGTAAIQVGTISSIGTIDRVTSIGTLDMVTTVGTVNKVIELGTVNYVALLGTINRVTSIGTLDMVTTVGTINKVVELGTVNYVALLGTINRVTSIGTLDMVTTVGTVNKVIELGTVNYVALLGTINRVTSIGTLDMVTTVGTINKITDLGTITNVIGTVKVNLVDRTFTSITQTITVAASTVTYTNLINVSKFEDTSWYLRNISATNRVVSVRLAATPSSTLTTYPRVLISETATVNASPQIITNDYYLQYISAQINNTATIAQNVVVVFNGRY